MVCHKLKVEIHDSTNRKDKKINWKWILAQKEMKNNDKKRPIKTFNWWPIEDHLIVHMMVAGPKFDWLICSLEI